MNDRCGRLPMRITFMIATHNRLSELEKTLPSCLASTGPAADVPIVADASPDGRPDAVRMRIERECILVDQQFQPVRDLRSQ